MSYFDRFRRWDDRIFMERLSEGVYKQSMPSDATIDVILALHGRSFSKTFGGKEVCFFAEGADGNYVVASSTKHVEFRASSWVNPNHPQRDTSNGSFSEPFEDFYHFSTLQGGDLMSSAEKLFSVTSVAKQLDCSRAKAYRLVRSGQIVADVNLGEEEHSALRVRESELQRFIDSKTVKP